MTSRRVLVPLTLALTVLAVTRGQALRVETLRSIGGLPPHIAGGFNEAVGFQQGPDGTYYVFDRRAHAVFAVNAARTAVRTLVDIGQEEGRVIQPAASTWRRTAASSSQTPRAIVNASRCSTPRACGRRGSIFRGSRPRKSPSTT